MRRRDPDALTPRERQVLQLIQQGYTNRGIAEALQISPAGARYHVSAILAKLGVSTRQEAARIGGRSRRWAFAPIALSDLRLHTGRLFASKVALLTLVTLAAGGIGIGGVVLASLGADGPSDSDGREATAVDLCNGGPCTSVIEVEYSTLEAAAVHASFVPMMPAFIPDGFTQHRISAKQRDFTNPYVPEVHNDWITVVYRDAARNRLVVSQGFPAMINARYAMPGADKQVLRINGREALWSDRVPLRAPRFNPTTDLGSALTLYVGRFRSGWGEDGSWFSGSPMEYSVASDSLSLEQLVKIAESVALPAIIEPNEGFSPESYFE